MLEKIETIRDEIKLQTHLLRKDLTKRLDDVSHQWDGVLSTTQRARREVMDATSLLADTIREGYLKVKNSLSNAKHPH